MTYYITYSSTASSSTITSFLSLKLKDKKALAALCHFVLTWRSIQAGCALHLLFTYSTKNYYKIAPLDLQDLVHFDCVPASQWKQRGFWLAEWQSQQLDISQHAYRISSVLTRRDHTFPCTQWLLSFLGY